MKAMHFLNEDKMVTIQLHKSDFESSVWETLKKDSYWFEVLFCGERIIRILTWESNYSTIQEMYNFN